MWRRSFSAYGYWYLSHRNLSIYWFFRRVHWYAEKSAPSQFFLKKMSDRLIGFKILKFAELFIQLVLLPPYSRQVPKQWIKGNLFDFICEAKSVSNYVLIQITCSHKVVQLTRSFSFQVGHFSLYSLIRSVDLSWNSPSKKSFSFHFYWVHFSSNSDRKIIPRGSKVMTVVLPLSFTFLCYVILKTVGYT